MAQHGKHRSLVIRSLTCVALLWAASVEAAPNCRQALALGLDVSGSVDPREYRLQLDGLAAAFESPAVAKVLLEEPNWPVRIAVYEWSGPRKFNRRILFDWQNVATQADLSNLATQLRSTIRRPADPSTALGDAMRFGIALLRDQRDCLYRTLDISGDGKSNTGQPPEDVTPPNWITINGLVIAGSGRAKSLSVTELSAYYSTHVLHGPGAFVETAEGFEDFQSAMTRKLLSELKSLEVSALQ